MRLSRLLIANRGEIAIRIARSAAEAGIATAAVYSADDAQSLHVRATDHAVALPGSGPAAYLDIAAVVAAARANGCDAVHPGYGFLAENAGFARACVAAGLIFVGPTPDVLNLFGDKAAARRFAALHGVDVIAGTDGPTTLAQAQSFLADLGPGGAIMVKAIAGGGGRGMRPVTDLALLPAAFERCAAEALSAFGDGTLYVERLFVHPRHIEVQIIGDGTGAVAHLWERECSVQRERQKLIEIAPAPFLRPAVRDRMLTAAVKLAAAAKYRGAGTFEFLVDASVDCDSAAIAFIEANARIQVEHTVTEEVTGIDLVRAQLDIAGGATLAELGLTQADIPSPRGMALQARVNLETMGADASVRAAGGVLSAYDPPSGPGVRVDGYGYAGYRTNPRFDSLLAKVIVHARSGRFADAASKAVRALGEFRLAGAACNIGFLQALLTHPDLLAGRLHTRFVEEHIAALTTAAATPSRFFEPAGSAARRPGARVDATDPLAVVTYGKSGAAAGETQDATGDVTGDVTGPDGTEALRAPMQGTIVSLAAATGDTVLVGQEVLVMEAMKMQHPIAATVSGILRVLTVEAGETVFEGHPLAFIEPRAELGGAAAVDVRPDPDYIRPDLAEVLARRARTLDAARPKAVARRRATGQRTARENIADLVDGDSFVEYGGLTLAARRSTTPLEQLIDETPADGIIMGLATMGADRFPEDKARVGDVPISVEIGRSSAAGLDVMLRRSAVQELV